MPDLKTLYPSAEPVRIGKHTVKIHPAKLRNMQDIAALTAEFMVVLASPSAVSYTAFCTQNKDLIERVLIGQTTLKKKHVLELDAHEAAELIARLIFETQAAFNHALSGLALSQPDGAKSTSV